MMINFKEIGIGKLIYLRKYCSVFQERFQVFKSCHNLQQQTCNSVDFGKPLIQAENLLIIPPSQAKRGGS